ncbi:ATP-binding cassette domain-containing protein [Rhodobacteraceae bacterium CCMM004]|nr:ATP-binding cassette domain-containing protein [Rhodobacteraceae bacterium CCMM004]
MGPRLIVTFSVSAARSGRRWIFGIGSSSYHPIGRYVEAAFDARGIVPHRGDILRDAARSRSTEAPDPSGPALRWRVVRPTGGPYRPAMIAADEVRIATGRVVSLAVARGEGLVLAGASGAGKSLLLRRLADLDPGAGRLTLDGRDCAAISAPDYRRRVALVPAEPAFWRPSLRDHAPDADFEAVGLDGARPAAPVTSLSSGERMRGAIALAVARNPQVLLLDEPTGPLDPRATGVIEALLLRLTAAGTAVILTSHDPEQPRRLGFRLLSLP